MKSSKITIATIDNKLRLVIIDRNEKGVDTVSDIIEMDNADDPRTMEAMEDRLLEIVTPWGGRMGRPRRRRMA